VHREDDGAPARSPVRRSSAFNAYGSRVARQPDSAPNADGASAPTFVRELLKINGSRAASEGPDRSFGVPGFESADTGPLAFLLPAHRQGYSSRGGRWIRKARTQCAGDRVQRVQTSPIDDPQAGTTARVSSPLPSRDGYWSTKPTTNVLAHRRAPRRAWRAENSRAQQRNHKSRLRSWIERIDVTTRYKLVSFTGSEETFLLPESIETLEMFRGELQSHRTRRSSRTFADS